MKYYISGPISGTKDYMERFAAAEKQLKEKGYSVVNPAAVNAMLPEDTTYEEYMRMALTMLGMCDGIVMLDGWRDSIGANREYGYALGTEMEIIYPGGMITMADALKPAPTACQSVEPVDVWEDEEEEFSGAVSPAAEAVINEWESKMAEKKEEKEEKPAKEEKNPEKKTRKPLDHGKIIALSKAGWTPAKIADELGTTAGVISSTLYRLKKKNQTKE